MTIEEIERELDFTFPLPHRRDLENPNDKIHVACEFLVPGGSGGLDFLRANRSLRDESWQGWQKPYVAFATQGCGDWFAYDTSVDPYRVFYVGPMTRVSEAVARSGEDALVFPNYGEWKAYSIRTYEEDIEGC